MSGNKKDPINEIQRKISVYSQTDEFKIKKRFSQLGYATSSYYYRFENRDILIQARNLRN